MNHLNGIDRLKATDLAKAIAFHYKVSSDSLIEASLRSPLKLQKAVWAFLLRKYLVLPFADIARVVGFKDLDQARNSVELVSREVSSRFSTKIARDVMAIESVFMGSSRVKSAAAPMIALRLIWRSLCLRLSIT